MEQKSVYVIEMALGLALMGRNKLAAAVDSLVEKGAMSKQQAQEFLQAAQSEGAECKKSIGDQFMNSAKKVLGELGFASADDLDKVHQEIIGLKAMIKPPHSTEA
ncbi:MAG: hypothetical protein PHO37_04105 [Kiritimatiellae bacterium]|nr:hypothetical protein [Kiritimatiellia bacterium]